MWRQNEERDRRVQVLIVQDNADLGRIWLRFLERQGVEAALVTTQAEAFDALRTESFDALVLEPMLEGENGFVVADFAVMRQPEIQVIAVTKSSFFSDGSIFELIPNAAGVMRVPLRPDDLAAFLEHCDRKRKPQAGKQTLSG